MIKALLQCFVCDLFRNSTYCMKVSMSMTVEESDEGKCYSTKIRHLEKAEITHSKMITCPDIEDYMAPYKQPQMTWYKVRHTRPLSFPECSLWQVLCIIIQRCIRMLADIIMMPTAWRSILYIKPNVHVGKKKGRLDWSVRCRLFHRRHTFEPSVRHVCFRCEAIFCA